MTEERFWEIIQRSFDKCGGDLDEQEAALADELRPLSPEEIQAFNKIFEEQRKRAFTSGLWGAAYIINGGCSDDGFWYFLSWLISRGKVCFEKAVDDPDSLAEYPEHLEDGDAEFETFAYVACKIHETNAGEMPSNGVTIGEPAGPDWEEDDDEGFKKRWPKLYQKYLAGH